MFRKRGKFITPLRNGSVKEKARPAIDRIAGKLKLDCIDGGNENGYRRN